MKLLKLLSVALLLTLTLASCEREELTEEVNNEIIYPGESIPNEIFKSLNKKAYEILEKKGIKEKDLNFGNSFQYDRESICVSSTNNNGYTTGIAQDHNGNLCYFATNNETQVTTYDAPHDPLFFIITGWCYFSINVTEQKSGEGFEYEFIEYDINKNMRFKGSNGCYYTSYYNSLNDTYGPIQHDDQTACENVISPANKTDKCWVETPCPDGESVGCGYYAPCDDSIEEDRNAITPPDSGSKIMCSSGVIMITEKDGVYYKYSPNSPRKKLKGGLEEASNECANLD